MGLRKHILILSSCVLAVFALTACLEDKVLDSNPCDFPSIEGYSLMWSDEFEGSEINPDIWTHELGDGCQNGPDLCGWGNNELEWYTDEKKNSQVKDGNLIIRALRESTPVNGYDYTSARMITKNKADFKFGRMDIRAKLPKGKGLWPAIWMLPTENKFGTWPRSGEIDIMELIGDKPAEVLGTVHYGLDFWRFKSAYYELEEGDFSDDFHTFTLLWRDDCLRFMVDGVMYGNAITPSVTLPTGYPFNEKFHFILNVAVGGNLPGNPDATTTFPQEMVIDYVRVYQEN
ncbi:MAG: glycoside hydrolase family 16 protein [Bacteroidia bacterium]|nr:glycoside hydrolase family 16 protein [Bacteroidia bacterium]